jgi:hypothetical protein
MDIFECERLQQALDLGSSCCKIPRAKETSPKRSSMQKSYSQDLVDFKEFILDDEDDEFDLV